jgi:hypothetical protein
LARSVRRELRETWALLAPKVLVDLLGLLVMLALLALLAYLVLPVFRGPREYQDLREYRDR